MMILSVYPASRHSLVLGIALVIFGIIITIQITSYNKVKKEI